MSIGSLVSSGPLLLAIPVAAAAGAVTFLSPCVLPLVPGYLSYITGMSGASVAGVKGGAAEKPRAADTTGDAAEVPGGGATATVVAVQSVPLAPPSRGRGRAVLGATLF